jgi:tRNA-specific 2-thiouridylase
VSDKPDSVSICFVPDGDTARFVAERRPEAALPGPILDRQGRLLGTHAGIAGVTVGQRKGLGVVAGQRRFVLEVLPQRRTLVVGSREEALRPSALVERCQWLIEPEAWTGPVEVKFTYRDAPAAAQLRRLEGERVEVLFSTPQFGIAPGQAAVFYGGTRVLGGGWLV